MARRQVPDAAESADRENGRRFLGGTTRFGFASIWCRPGKAG